MKHKILFSSTVLAILLLSSSVPGHSLPQSTSPSSTTNQNERATITCYLGGVPQTTTVSVQSAQHLQELFNELARANAQDPQSGETRQLQDQILAYAEEQSLLPAGMTADQVYNQLQRYGERLATNKPHSTPIPSDTTDREFFCNFVTTGDGGAFPVIILPRLIPIIQLPIPRLFIFWKTDEGVTSVGGLISRTGFIAAGKQNGVAIGFWGVGFSIFLPPVSAYGLFGYALYAKVTATDMEQWPPNNVPEVSAVYPLDGAQHVPMDTDYLQFHIQDADNDLMSYSVTTSPDVGGGNANLKKDGTYQVPITGLQSSTKYTWAVQVSDGKDTTSATYTFTTEMLAPAITDPRPLDHAKSIPITLGNLSFTLTDYQDDLISYTVETSPDIGHGGQTNVHNGRFNIPIAGMQYSTQYTWYVNASDGTNTNHQVFTFQTAAENEFDFPPSDDNTIEENHPDFQCGSLDHIVVRGAPGWEWDILLRVDLSMLPTNITIRSATLQLYYFQSVDGNPAGHTVNFYKITSPWDENTSTWNNHPSYATQSSASGQIPSQTGEWMTVDVTNDILDFYHGTTTNYGWRLVDTSGQTQCTYFRSRQSPDYPPILHIEYDD